MKKTRRIATILVLALVAIAALCLAACESAKVPYAVTVLLPDNSPAKGVTVALELDGQVAASAQTDDNGVATISAPAEKYTVKISDCPVGLGFYEEVQTNTLGTPITVSLVEAQTNYTAAVRLPDGSGVANATVVWTDASDEEHTAVTDAQGNAEKLLPPATYTVTLRNLPEGYFLARPTTATPTSNAVTLTLSNEARVAYSVTVVTEGGLHYPNLKISASQGNELVATEKTDATGVANFMLVPGEYKITPHLPYGYAASKISYNVDADKRDLEVTIYSGVVPSEAPAGTSYTVGSIIHDFTVNTFDGKTVNLATLLETKSVVVLNFWYSTCSWCIREFPVMWEAYQEYSDDVEIVAIDPYARDFCRMYDDEESNNAVNNQMIEMFRMQAGLENATFPMAMDNAPAPYAGSIGALFPIEGFPTTVVVDRYGAVAMIESGAILQASAWKTIFANYSAEKYVQNFVPGETESPDFTVDREKPDVEMPESALLEAAINNTESGFNFSYLPETSTDDKEYSWPWVVAQFQDQTVIAPSNSGHNYTFATVHTTVTLKAGQAVAFDFFSSCEQGADILYVSVDGLVQFQISGLGKKWETCYAFVALQDGNYDLALLYYKDSSYHEGDDAVFVKNMRLCNADDIATSTDIIHACASEYNGADGYTNYVTPVLGADGFYRVNSADGPYLLFDLMHSTNWSLYSLVEYAYDEQGNFHMLDLDGDGKEEDCSVLLDKYIFLARYSDFLGMTPVNEECRTLFVAMMNKITQKSEQRDLHDNEWLEACKYVTRYGTSAPVQNPVIGLTEEIASPVSLGKNVMSLNKELFPCSGLCYTFTPETTGVYKFYSVGEDETQIFIYNDDGVEDGLLAYCGNDILGRTEEDDMNNFVLYHYMKQGVTYYVKVAYLIPGLMGDIEFYIDYLGEKYTVREHCTPGYATFIINEDESWGETYLESVEVVLKDGKYYAKSDDGSLSVVLVDFTGFTHANPYQPLKNIISSHYPMSDLKPFDFSRKFTYDEEEQIICDENGNPIVVAADGQDYTQRMLEILATADADGYVEATEELVAILKCYSKRELFGLDNDWLMFCKYDHTYAEPTEE